MDRAEPWNKSGAPLGGGPEVSRARLKRLARLNSAKERAEAGLILLEGPHLVAEAARAGALVELFVRDALEARSWQAAAVPIHIVGDSGLLIMADVRTPQRVIGIGRPLAFAPPKALFSPTARLILLDGLQDPGNVGTIARTAAALGATGLCFGDAVADPDAPKVLRASAGALFRLQLAKGPQSDWPILAKEARLPLFVLDPHGGTDLCDLHPPKAYALVLGHEGQGSRLEGADTKRLKIPLQGGVESLNVASALAVVLGRWL